MSVIIGIDPHKSSHTAVAISADEQPWPACRSRLIGVRPHDCWRGRHRWMTSRRGRSSPRAGSASSSPNSSRRRRARRRRAPDPVGSGAVVGLDEGVEERPQRRVGHRLPGLRHCSESEPPGRLSTSGGGCPTVVGGPSEGWGSRCAVN